MTAPYAPEYGVPTDARFRRYVWEQHSGLCGLCGEAVPLNEMHLDHIQPRTKGGTDHISNLRPTHQRCNAQRGNGDRKYAPSHSPPEGAMAPDELLEARLALGLTQRGLAEALGVPQSTLWRWETGKHTIERPKMLRLALWALEWKPLVPSAGQPGDVLIATLRPL